MMTGDAASAESAFAEAQRRDPYGFEIALRRINAAIIAGRGELELARLEEACGVDPLDVVLLTARGALLERLGRGDEAIDVLEAAVELAPEALCPAVALAEALIHTGQIVKAVPALRHVTELAPDEPSHRNNLAAALTRVHRYREAREVLEALEASHGPHHAMLCNLTNALVCLGLQDEGVATARRAIELAPEENLPWRTLTSALAYADGIDGAALLEAACRAGETVACGPAPVFANRPDSTRRIRLGLLSTSLRTHPVGWLTAAGFEALDPREFEIVCFGQAPSDDPIQRRFAALASAWHVVGPHRREGLAARIRDQEIDVLIEMSGWGEQGLLSVCAERTAPVQVKWVGMQNHSTGIREMDWFLTDRWETPLGFERFYCERLLRLGDGYVCYTPPPGAPDVGPLPALARGFVTFGCFNNVAKVTPRVIATWSKILRRVPGARLVLKTHQLADQPTAERLCGAFAQHGIDRDRIELRGGSAHRMLLDEYNGIDIVLDPFPYTGGLTTCEALWMGVPTITVPGETFSSRHAMSHLSNVGLADWVAEDVAGYEEMAVRRAADLRFLAELRAGLRAQVKASPLCDAPRFGRSLAEALRFAWRDWCERQGPARSVAHSGRIRVPERAVFRPGTSWLAARRLRRDAR
jgi:predicted O-linked N-acetylglucosamine transferase (SPINDLY family)